MVYCTKCGGENPDNAKECKNCGAPLGPTRFRVSRRQWEDDMCFGTKRGLPVWGIIFGILIILVGVISLLEDVYWWASWEKLWPILVIAFGLLIIINIITRR